MFRVSQFLTFSLFFVLSFINTHYQAMAQSSGSTTGSIVGTVKDQQGAVIVGSRIRIREVNTNFVRIVEVGEDGNYNAAQLPPGNYELTVQAEGFAQQIETITVNIGRTVLAKFTLQLGKSSDVIEVVAGSFDEGKTESSTIVDRNGINNLPINQRNFLDFSLTSPRVTRDRLPPNGVTATSGISFNGQSARLNRITIDGNSSNDNFTAGVLSTFSQDAVEEFQIVSDSYSAEFGRAVGGIVNIVTRSGSNDLHSSLFEFTRNDAISAREAFSSFKPEFKQYQFGATLSGPIKRDRAFFFTSFERLSIKQNVIVTIPNDVVTSAHRQRYPELVNGALPFAVGTTTVLARADLQLTPADRLTARYNGGFTYNGAFETVSSTLGGLISPTSSGIQKLKDNTINFNNTYAHSNFVNETRFLYSRRNQNVLSADSDNAIVLLNTGEGQIAFGQNFLTPQMRSLRIYQIVDNVSIVAGRQQFKFGIDFDYTSAPDRMSDFPLLSGGFYVFVPIDFAALLSTPGLPLFSALQSFDSSLRTPEQRAFLTALAGTLPSKVPGFPSGVPLADMALPAIYQQSFGDFKRTASQKLFSFFLQDDIKLRSNLLVKAGLRYDIYRQTFTPGNNGNFSPRLALSYQPTPKLTVHAAYGIFFGSAPTLQTAIITDIYNNQGRTFDPNSALLQFFLFPFSVFPFDLPGHHFPENGLLPPGVQVIPQLTQSYRFQPNLRNSYSHQVTAGFSHQIFNNTLLSVDYNFVRGIKLFSGRDVNLIVRPIPGDPATSAITGRIDPSRGRILEFESAFDSYYNGLTISINRRLANRLSFLISYTLSKGIDNFVDFRSDIASANDSLKPGLERGLSLQDVRNRFVLSGTWELSYTRRRLLRDYQFSVISELISGRPYNLLSGVDLNLNGDVPPADRPLGISRNAGITPSFANVDLRLSRNLTIKERYRLRGTIEAFNLFNRVNISQFNNIFPPDAEGRFNLPQQKNGRYIVPRERYTNSFSPRQIQVGLRLEF